MELRFKIGHCCACNQFKYSVYSRVAQKCQAKGPISHYEKSTTSLVSSKMEMVRQWQNLREILKFQEQL